jgi:hypothetical protein
MCSTSRKRPSWYSYPCIHVVRIHFKAFLEAPLLDNIFCVVVFDASVIVVDLSHVDIYSMIGQEVFQGSAIFIGKNARCAC